MKLFSVLLDLACRLGFFVGAITYSFFIYPDNRALVIMLLLGVAILLPESKPKIKP